MAGKGGLKNRKKNGKFSDKYKETNWSEKIIKKRKMGKNWEKKTCKMQWRKIDKNRRKQMDKKSTKT